MEPLLEDQSLVSDQIEPEPELQTQEPEYLPEEVGQALWEIVNRVETADNSNRIKVLTYSKRNDLFFKGIQYLLWNSAANDWEIPESSMMDGVDDAEFDARVLNRIINIIRPNVESIVAALSAALPTVKFFPEDSDQPEDVTTSKAWSNLADLIQLKNDAKLKFIQLIYSMIMNHYTAIYNYPEEHEKNGKYKVPVYGTKKIIQSWQSCLQCGMDVEESEMMCPQCGSDQIDSTQSEEEIPFIQEYREAAKTMEKIEIFSPMNVKIPTYVAQQDEKMGYLILEQDMHYALLRSIYPEIADKIIPGDGSNSDRWARIYNYSSDEGLVTVRHAWFRPWMFQTIEDEEIRAQLLQLFPEGCCAVFIENQFVEAYNENLDTRWTIPKWPLSEYITAEPLVNTIVPIQEMRNSLVNLTIETIEHGISETFVDPQVVDTEVYSQTPSAPGNLYPVKNVRPGVPLDQSFASLKPAILSQEVPTVFNILDADTKFLTGNYPAVYGGPNDSGSKTFSEYSMSRTQALQRLALIWTTANVTWAKVLEKSVLSFIENLVEDEKFSKQQGDGYVNIWIRQSELAGKIGRVQAESSEQFPMSWSQKRDALFKLLELGFEPIVQAMSHPENSSLLTQFVGVDEFYFPGSEDRDKQLSEIAELLRGQPQIDPANPQVMMPSVPIEPDVDNDQVHIFVTQAWLVSPVGQDTKLTNPGGYQNVVAHLQMHMQKFMMEQQPPPAGNENGSEQPS